MENSKSREPAENASPEYKTLATIILLSSSFAVCFFMLLSLTRGPFLTGPSLYLAYFTYAACLLMFLHAAFFFASSVLKGRGKKLDKKVPKYLEYAYALVLSISLAQIFFAAPRLADYLVFVSGDSNVLLNRIRETAITHVRNDCKIVDKKYFTEAFCAKLKEISVADDLRQFIFRTAIHDVEFMHHAIGTKVVPAGFGAAVIDVYSPIVFDIENLEALEIYKTEKEYTFANNIFGWIAIMLLPLGIGLRLVKTSLELFVDLE